jgi:hypothetical protein
VVLEILIGGVSLAMREKQLKSVLNRDMSVNGNETYVIVKALFQLLILKDKHTTDIIIENPI